MTKRFIFVIIKRVPSPYRTPERSRPLRGDVCGSLLTVAILITLVTLGSGTLWLYRKNFCEPTSQWREEIKKLRSQLREVISEKKFGLTPHPLKVADLRWSNISPEASKAERRAP